MAEITSINDAKILAKQVTNEDAQLEAQAKRKEALKEIQNLVDSFNTDSSELKGIATILALPEEKFALLAPVFLVELEQSYNKVNDKLLFAQSLQLSGVHLEDVKDNFLQIIAEIDKLDDQVISLQKRDFLKKMVAIILNAIADLDGIDKRYVNLPIEFIHPDAKMPEYAHVSDSGMDVFAVEDIDILPGETKLIPTGLKFEIPMGYELQVRPKSSRASKTKMILPNSPGTIDAGYRDELKIICENIDNKVKDIESHYDDEGHLIIDSILYGSPIHIGKGEKICQIVLAEVPKAVLFKVDKVNELGDRGGGFGSTGMYAKDDIRNSVNEQN